MIPPDEFQDFSREAEEQRLQKSFKDFLIVPEIGGSQHTYNSNRRIPAEKTVDSGQVVEIAKDSALDDSPHDQNSVLVHRNTNNEITHIEIACTCGRKTIIRLESDNEHIPHDPNLTITDFEGQQETTPQSPFGTENEKGPL